MKRTEIQTDPEKNNKEVCCIDLFFKDPNGKRHHIQFNGRWIVKNETNCDGVLVSVAITEKNQFYVYHDLGYDEAYYDIFSSWEELLDKQYYDESILDLIWAEIKDSMLEVLDT